jgi:dTDP-4-amino-4,6-dideoxy-D-galactose acyltransferase
MNSIFIVDNSISEENRVEIYNMVNSVYKLFEADLWGDDYERISLNDLNTLIDQGSIAICVNENEVIVGVVKIILMDDEIGEFGMLVTKPSERGAGIASQLVSFSEEYVKSKGRIRMRLEILKPTSGHYPDKEKLDKWYSKIGYRMVSKEPFEKMYPKQAPKIKMECDFLVYLKDL